jgi:Tfp pilus assembly protein PilO
MKIRDRKRWERELTDHMRRHAADLQDSPVAREPAGMWMTAPRLILWTLMVVIITSVGWAVGLYFC